MIQKTFYQAKVELESLLEELRVHSAENLSLEYLADTVRQLDILLWSRLPECVKTSSLSGFIAINIIHGIMSGRHIESECTRKYSDKANTITEAVLNYLPIKWQNINLKFWVEELFNVSGNFKYTEHAIAQQKIEPPKSSLTLAETLELIGSNVLSDNIKKLFYSCDKIDTLLKKFKESDRDNKDDNTAICLLELGNFWREEATMLSDKFNKNTQIMLTYALMFYNAAFKVCKDEEAKYQIAEIIKKTSILIVFNGECVWYEDEKNKKLLHGLRTEFDDSLNNILHTKVDANDNDGLLVRADSLQRVINNLIIDMKSFISNLISQAIISLGPAPCSYSFIGLGSLEKQSFTPYSDLEFAILLGEDNKKNRQYFRNLSYILQAKIINLGETPIPFNLFNISFDHITNMGFCFDLGGKTALGRYYDEENAGTKYGQLKYELIGAPSELVKYLETQWFKVDKFLPIEVASCTHICGDNSLTEQYQRLVQERLNRIEEDGDSLYQQRANKLLNEDLERYVPQFEYNESGKIYDVKKEIYRVPDRLVDNLAFFYKITVGSIIEKIKMLVTKTHISQGAGENLRIISGIANELRLITYNHYHQQKDKIWILGFSEGSKEQKNFYLATNRDVLERFYYTAIPFCQDLIWWLETHLDLKEKVFFDNGGSIQANIYIRLYDYESAKSCLKKVLETNPEDKYAVNNLGCVQYALCNYKEALEYHKALALNQKVYGLKHTDVASSLNNIGLVYYSLGYHKEALECHQKALEIWKYTCVDSHPDVAFSLNNIGAIYESLSNHKKALEYFQKSLELNQKIYGLEHTYVAICLSNIGSAYYGLNNYNEALEYFQNALELRQKIYGIEHPLVASSLNNIGVIYKSLRNHKEALECHQKALEIWKCIYGDQHADVASSLNNIGLVYYGLNNYNEALEYFQNALELRQKIYGIEHHLVASNLNNIGLVYRSLGSHKEALECHQKALKVWKCIYGDQHADVASSLNNIGLVYENLGNYKEALEYLQNALELKQKLYGLEHAEVASSLNNIGLVYKSLGNHKEALEYFKKALKIWQKTYGDEHTYVATCLNNIGGIYYYSLGNHKEEALEYFKKALELRQKLYGLEHAEVASSLNNIGLVYKSLGNHKEALEHLQKALKIWQKTYEDEHTYISICLNNIEKEKQVIIIILLQKYKCIDKEHTLRTIANLGNLEDLKLLLKMDVDINQAGPKTGKTAMHYAAQKGHLKVVEMLITSGANIDLKDKDGATPLDLALQVNHEEVIKLIKTTNFLISEGSGIPSFSINPDTKRLDNIIFKLSQKTAELEAMQEMITKGRSNPAEELLFRRQEIEEEIKRLELEKTCILDEIKSDTTNKMRGSEGPQPVILKQFSATTKMSKFNFSIFKAISEYNEPTLDMRNKHLTDDDLIELCSYIQRNSNIKCLLLSHNQITSRGAGLLTELPYIESLSLAYNHLDDSCLLKLAKSKLKSLDLSWNNITDKGVDTLIQNSTQNSITVDSLFVSQEKHNELIAILSKRRSCCNLSITHKYY